MEGEYIYIYFSEAELELLMSVDEANKKTVIYFFLIIFYKAVLGHKHNHFPN